MTKSIKNILETGGLPEGTINVELDDQPVDRIVLTAEEFALAKDRFREAARRAEMLAEIRALRASGVLNR